MIVGAVAGDKVVLVGVSDPDRLDIERKFHIALETVFLFKVEISVNDILERVYLSDFFLCQNVLLVNSEFTNPHLFKINYPFIKCKF